MIENILGPSGWGKSKLRTKSALILWEECKKEPQCAQGANADAIVYDQSLALDKRNELLVAYTKRCHSTLQLEHQPSEATMNLLIKRRAKNRWNLPSSRT